jgi:WD40 repeat protein
MRSLRVPLLLAAVLTLVRVGDLAGQDPKDVRLVVQTGHQYPVMAVAFFPDGKRLLTASGDFTLRSWDVQTGKELFTYRGHTNWVIAAALSGDGNRIVSASLDKSVRVWDARTGEVLHTLTDHADGVSAVAVSRDGSRFLTAGKEKVARLWNTRTGKEVRTFSGHAGPVEAVAFSPDGKHVLTGSADKTARLWNAQTGKEEVAFKGHKEDVTSVAFGPDGKRVLTGSGDKTVRLWNADNGTELKAFRGQPDLIWSVSLSPDGKQVLACGDPDPTHTDSRTARLWDVESGKVVHVFREVPATRVRAAAFSPDGKYVVTGGYHDLARLWDVKTGEQVREFMGQGLGGGGLGSGSEYAADGRSLFLRIGRHVQQWDLRAGRVLRTLECPDKKLYLMAFSHDRKLAVAKREDGSDDTPRLIEFPSGKELHALKGHKARTVLAAFSPDDGLVLTGSDDKTARLWNVRTGKELKVLSGHKGEVSAVMFSPDGGQALTLSQTFDNKSWKEKKLWRYDYHPARLWDVKTGKELLVLPNDRTTSGVASAAFSPDGKQILTGGGDDHTARLLDARTGKELFAFRGHTEPIRQATFSPDGKTGRTLGGQDRTARLWDLQTGKELGVFRTGDSGYYPFAFSPDNRFVLTQHHLLAGVRVREFKGGKDLCTLFSFADGSWAVVDADGRYDASNGGDVEGLHWVANNEPIALKQLKERYYDPGLLAKHLRFNKEPLRDVATFKEVKFYPTIDIDQKDAKVPRLDVTLTDRGGGIGKVVVLVNGKEATDDARPEGAKANAKAAKLDLQLDLSSDPRVVPGKKNRVEVLAYNAEGYLASRGMVREFDGPGKADSDPTTLHAVIVGVSKYSGKGLDLKYAAKDADDFAFALELGARRFFDPKNEHPERVRITRLTAAAGESRPTKAALARALGDLKATKPGDVVVIYLAGHGVTQGGADSDWHYLTADAQSANLADPAVRKKVSLSSAELTELLKAAPAQKQVLILDTCHAAGAFKNLIDKRDVPGSQVRALERVKDRTGMHVLAGCAADSVSYEATRFGQGLLTYSLLMAMRFGNLREREYVDVVQLFGFAADKVPELARDIGGVQRPTVASPSGGSFDIGRLTAQDRDKVPLQSARPVVLRSSFQLEEPARDSLGLSRKVNDRLNEASAARGAKLVFVDADECPGGVQPSGRYEVDGDKVTVRVSLFQGDKKLAAFSVPGAATRVDELAEKIAAEVEKKLAAAPK